MANDEFADPSGRVYVLWNLLGYSADHPGMSYTSSGGGMTPIYYFYDAICDGGQSVAKMGSNNIAFVIVLEGGGSYCVSN